ncbi:dihydroorotate dehydrogenase electron transfer subunit [Desulfobulbus alkaliphilus]|uniref:dihydroorotate dehydrogenase electron transfer subunit n=1 Tax=Desulfobulbus alkaliphilus TaxID=869814 RepID=UPI001963B9E6|nr:dihydroorotate dehydrogenase electron transfer subunit [Desulfobulbus alkaliphilus]MBM9536654.1 dihydroorotate dehydrogenase electron transfer subunit [Desulfobulbus alkaliphilus]
MREYQENSVVQAIDRLSDSFHRLTLFAPRIAAAARPGQFVMASCGTTLDPLLRRPFSIHQAFADGALELLVKVIGRGTSYLSTLRPGAELSLIGPLGRGFHLTTHGPVTLVGGGIGIAPLLFLASHLPTDSKISTCTVLLGSRTNTDLLVLTEEFKQLGCQVRTATDDGSLGHHGFVSELLPAALPGAHMVFTCGPHAMMTTVARLCLDAGIRCEASLEAHMACGLGACLGCTIHGAGNTYRHVCKHGPVFDATEVAWTP